MLLVPAVAGAAGGPLSEPVLRLEPGMHTAMINRIDVDAAQRFVVSASDDKTVRVWALPTGQLLKTLRPPIGSGYEGSMNAVAISPNGETIAAGGWTSKSGLENSIYLFNRATGRLQYRITNLANVINHLAFSPDGQYLVATLALRNGIRVFRSKDWRLVAGGPKLW